MSVAEPRHVCICAAEDSADMHAAAFVRAARRRWPACRFSGLTGVRMRAAGVETVDDLAAHAAMLTGALTLIRRARRAVRSLECAWRTERPDCVVLLDSPELNLRIAARAKQSGLRVLYYIAPQTWATRPWRERTIRRIVDHVACILPFEQEYFRGRGVAATYVGHPLFETLAETRAAPEVLARLRTGDGPLVALLPGSRRGVVRAVLPLQLQVIEALRRGGVPVRVAVSSASAERGREIELFLRAAGVGDAHVVDDNAALLEAADLALVASGTATLHVAAYRTPMIVMYDAGPVVGGLHSLFSRRLLHTPHLSLVNILAQARVVPEFMPRVPDVTAVAAVAAQLLRQTEWRAHMRAQLDAVVAPLERTRPSDRVCDLAGELLAPAAIQQ